MPQNLSKAVQLLWGLFVAPEWFLFLMVVVQVPLSWVRDIRKLTATTLLANLLILYGLVVCIILALGQAISGDDEVATPLQSIAQKFQTMAPFGKDWFMFIGTSVSRLTTVSMHCLPSTLTHASSVSHVGVYV